MSGPFIGTFDLSGFLAVPSSLKLKYQDDWNTYNRIQLVNSNISYGSQPCPDKGNCPNISSVYMAKYAIEMNEGEAAIYGFMNGTQLTVV